MKKEVKYDNRGRIEGYKKIKTKSHVSTCLRGNRKFSNSHQWIELDIAALEDDPRE